jgi:hypothetical protein
MKNYLLSAAFYAGSAITIAMGHRFTAFALFMIALSIFLRSPFFDSPAQE